MEGGIDGDVARIFSIIGGNREFCQMSMAF
jgi:hypothetical protein